MKGSSTVFLHLLAHYKVNILQPSDDIETSAMDCANLRPDGEYLRPEEPRYKDDESLTLGSDF